MHVCSTTAHHWLDGSLFADCPQLKIQDSPVRLLGTGLVQHHQTKALCLTIWASHLWDACACVYMYMYVCACVIQVTACATIIVLSLSCVVLVWLHNFGFN